MRSDDFSGLPTVRLEYIALLFLGLTPFIVLGQVYVLALHATLWLGKWPSARLIPNNILFKAHFEIVSYCWLLYPISPVLLAAAGAGFLWLQRRDVRVGPGVILFVLSAVIALNIEQIDPGGAVNWFVSSGGLGPFLGPCRSG